MTNDPMETFADEIWQRHAEECDECWQAEFVDGITGDELSELMEECLERKLAE